MMGGRQRPLPIPSPVPALAPPAFPSGRRPALAIWPHLPPHRVCSHLTWPLLRHRHPQSPCWWLIRVQGWLQGALSLIPLIQRIRARRGDRLREGPDPPATAIW